MFKVLLFSVFLQLCFCECPNGTETSFTNPNICYLFVAKISNFINAEGYCSQQQKGGHLASVSNAFDNMFLSSKASLYFSNSTDADFWIGGTNELTPGNWSWLDGTPFIYSDWMKGQPENIASSNCSASSITTSLWSAFDCFKTKPFVCMFPASSPTTTTVIPTTKKIPTCEEGWHLFETTGFCYLPFSSKNFNWQDAESYCFQQHNSHLVSIHSQIESDFVGDLVRSYARDTCYPNQTWIGLFSVTTEHNWIWTDGTPYDFPGWSPGEPNGSGGANCAELMINSCGGDNMNYWNDQECFNTMEYFVCKKQKS